MRKDIRKIIALILLELVLMFPVSFAFSISDIRTEEITSDSAKVLWRTDEYATGEVNYGKTESLGQSETDTHYLFDHLVTLTGLEGNTVYYFSVESTDINGTTKLDDNSGSYYTFKTLDSVPPEKITGLEVESIDYTDIKIKWAASTAEDLSNYIVYRDSLKIANTTQASYQDSGLISGRSYIYRVAAVDTSGNQGEQSDPKVITTKEHDIIPPAISSVTASINGTTAVISWTTNENSDSAVMYSEDDFLDMKKTDSEEAIDHRITLSGLSAGSAYNYKVQSCDTEDNCANSSLYTFSVAASETTPEVATAQFNVNTTIPRYYNKRTIDIEGTVPSYSTVRIYVNDMANARRILGRGDTADAKFRFYNVQLAENNVLKIVVEDSSGKTDEKSFDITVDTEKPVVSLKEIPSVVRSKNFAINGTVNEYVTLNIYLASSNQTVPAMVEGLTAVKSNGSVELTWNRSTESDFSHYIIYRKDVGAIATAKPASYNSYKDLLVNKDESYTYEVSAVNELGKEGPHSESRTVLVTDGGTGIPKPSAIVDAVSVEDKPSSSQEISGSFTKNIDLDEGDNYVRIEFIDKAGNKVAYEKRIFVDTKKPDLEIINPRSGAMIYENYADQITIVGKTEAGADVHLYINRMPFGTVNSSFSVSGLADRLEGVSSSDLMAESSFIPRTSWDSMKADYSTTADSSGNFRFDDVDLTTFLTIGGTISEQSVIDYSKEDTSKPSTSVDLIFVASDSVGLKNAKDVKYNIGTCWSGNFSWDIIPLVEYQSPSALSPERLRENTEQLFFYFNYSYTGRGSNGRILQNGVSVTKACGDLASTGDSRFNVSCKIMPEGAHTVVNPEGTTSYTTMNLNKIEGMERWLGSDWEDFFDAVSNEMTFPLLVKITYEHTVDGKTVRETQTTCQEVTYVLDNSIVDFRNILPDWVLYDFVDLLNSSIDTITTVQETLRDIIEYTAYGCLASWALHISIGVVRRFSTIMEENKLRLKLAANSATGTELKLGLKSQEDEDYCKKVIKAVQEKYNDVRLKYLSDHDLKKCFPSIDAWWERESMLYKSSRMTCDRIFGHPSPAKWTENEDDQQLYDKKMSGTGCSTDQSVIGQPLLAVKCRDVAQQFRYSNDVFKVDDKCFVVTKNNKQYLFSLGDVEDRQNNIYKISIKNLPVNDEVSIIYAIKQNDDRYLTSQAKTCAQVCGLEDTKGGARKLNTKRLWNDGNLESPPEESKPEGYFRCMPVHECSVLKDKKPGSNGGVKVENSVPRGYTEDCFYKANEIYKGVPRELANPNSISDDPNLRYECCCINAIKAPESQFYKFDDNVPYKVDGKEFPAFVKEEDRSDTSESSAAPKQAEQYKDMEWSYRYWKEKFETVGKGKDGKEVSHFGYNPDRYIDGRDFWACFGQNSWLDRKVGLFSSVKKDSDGNPIKEDGSVLILDPAKDHLAAFQCLHLSGIYNRLQTIKNIMSALSSCLVTVRTTGTADTGVCKELFTQYVCSLIWHIIQLFMDGCLPFGHGISIDENSNEVVQYVKGGFQSVWGSIVDKQGELASEYGNAKLNNLIGIGEEQLARKICLAAFGYDWELDLGGILDASYASSYATLVQGMTGTREYLTIDPQTNKARYEYRGSWLINPGCDLRNYKVELACVSRNEMNKYEGINCAKVNDPAGNNCDCIGLVSGEKVTGFYTKSGKLAQGVLDTPSHHSIVQSDYRYDHLKFTLYPDTRIKSDLRDDCFPEGHEDGVFYFPLRDKTMVDIADCHIDATQGIFRCNPSTTFWSEQARAYFTRMQVGVANQLVDVSLTSSYQNRVGDSLYTASSVQQDTVTSQRIDEKGYVVAYVGDKLSIVPTVKKLEGAPVCLVIEVKKGGTASRLQSVPISSAGEQAIPIMIDDSVKITATGGTFTGKAISCQPSEKCNSFMPSARVNVRPILNTNPETKTVAIEFKDVDGNGFDLTDMNNNDQIIVGSEAKTVQERWNPRYKRPSVKLGDVELVVYSVSYIEGIKSVTYNVEISPVKEGEQYWTITTSLRYPRNTNQNDNVDNVVSRQSQENTASTEDLPQGVSTVQQSLAGYDCDHPGAQLAASIGTTSNIVNLKVISGTAENPYAPKIDLSNIPYEFIKRNQEDRIKFSFTVSDDNKINTVKMKSPSSKDLKDFTGDSRLRTYTVDITDDIREAGKYTLRIEAVDGDSPNRKTSQAKEFNVMCYGNDPSGVLSYGECKDDCGTAPEIMPSNDSLKCKDGKKCCKRASMDQ